jgi:hypothetical protein
MALSQQSPFHASTEAKCSLRDEGLIRLAYCNNGVAVLCEGRAMIIESRVPKGNANRTNVRSDPEQTVLRARTQ